MSQSQAKPIQQRNREEHTSWVCLKNSSEWMFGRERNKNSVLTTLILGLLGTFRWILPQIKVGNIEDDA